VFLVQDEIANSVVGVLQIALAGGPLRGDLGGTHNLDAYQLYLRAVAADQKNTTTSLRDAEALLRKATALDPGFGLAWDLMASVTANRADLSDLLPSEGYERSRELARHALDVSPGLLNAHSTLGYVYRSYDWNWAASAEEYQRVLSADPTNVYALDGEAILAMTLGQWDRALRAERAALAGDPLQSFANYNLGTELYHSGRLSEADSQFRHLMDLFPTFEWARPALAKTLLAEGRPADALAQMDLKSTSSSNLDYLSVVLWANHRSQESDAALAELISRYGKTDAFYVAQAYAYRNDKERAFEWLDRAYSQKDSGLVEFLGEPVLKNLEGDPRYGEFLRKINLSD